MNIRPRCREWLPLATQQLRLRNLIRIQGHNIQSSDSEETLIYYTLHHTKNEIAFYTSEALPRRQVQQKWAEIACPEMLKSNANCVCVKVWARLKPDGHLTERKTKLEEQLYNKESISALYEEPKNDCLSPNNLPRPPDKLLFTWGVYFSGLIPMSQQSDAKSSANSLIFQLNGEYFASPTNFTVESLQEQLVCNYKRYSSSIPKSSSLPPPPVEFSEYSINSPQVSRSSSPVPVNQGLAKDLLRMSQTRYLQLNCTRTEVRRSYNLEKLLKIQELQRQHLQLMRERVELAAEIKQLSIRCITQDQILRKARTTSLSASTTLHQHHQHHSMGRALSVLLAEQQQVDPKALLRAQQLQQELETVRCKQRFLQAEQNTYVTRNTQLRVRLTSLTQSYQELQSWLLTSEDKLEQDKQQLAARYQQKLAQLQTKRQIVQQVERRMSSLCMELREIYPINRNQQGYHTICGISFPKVDTYVSDDGRYMNSLNLENISPLALSASLGYIAHLVQMVAVILNRPLRNPILHEGSRSRIMDIIKDLAYTTREYPLYTRSTILSKPVKYAIYLLNQNIAQLCYDLTGVRCDLRGTIENILLIFSTLAEIERSEREIHGGRQTHPNNRLKLHSISECESGCGSGIDGIDGLGVVGNICTLQSNSNDGLSKSHSSVDMNHVPVPMTQLSSLLEMPGHQTTIAERSLSQQRCRSLGSYSDCEDDFKEIIEHCYSNSDSNIVFQGEHV